MLQFYASAAHITGCVKTKQIAEYLGAGFNSNCSKDDICICLQSIPPAILKNSVADIYLDIGDCIETGRSAYKLYGNRVIYILNDEHAKEEFLSNMCDGEARAIVIRHQHCNFDNIIRPDREVKLVGYVGSSIGLDYNPNLIRAVLQNQGMEFACLFIDFPAQASRIDVCNFIQALDIQICMRQFIRMICNDFNVPILKIVNAGSFRIPTVAYPEKSFLSEANGAFIPAEDVVDLVANCMMLRECSEQYNLTADRALELSKDYDISVVAKQYADLERVLV